MKNKIKLIFIAFILFALCSCRPIFVKGTVYVMDCEHGSLVVTHESGEMAFVITAKPDEGYCLLKENLFVRELNAGRLYTDIGVKEIEENVYGIKSSYVDDDSTIVVTGLFTEVENKK